MFLVLVPAHQAHAAGCDVWSFDLGSCMGTIAYGINYILAIVWGIFIAIIVWCIEVVLAMNDQVVNTGMVRNGVQCLAFHRKPWLCAWHHHRRARHHLEA